MSRHHHRHKRGWARIRARLFARRGGAALAAVDRAVLKCIILGRCLRAARTTKR